MNGHLSYQPLDWKRHFVIVPRRTISNRWVWGHCFSRIVFVTAMSVYGPCDDQETEYGDMFDVLGSL